MQLAFFVFVFVLLRTDLTGEQGVRRGGGVGDEVGKQPRTGSGEWGLGFK